MLLATSGTAAVEFAPAVVEAALSRVPLVVLTADRPAELRDRGAPQTIDQDHLYGRAAKWFTELPLFDGDPATAAHVRSVAGRAVATAAAGPAGPVHVNVPFREPLLPDGPLEADGASDAPRRPLDPSRRDRRAPDASTRAAIDALAGRLAAASAGSSSRARTTTRALPAALAALARGDRLPDPRRPAVRAARRGPTTGRMVVARADQLVRPGAWIDAHRPDLVIRTGAMPTSKPILQLLDADAAGALVSTATAAGARPRCSRRRSCMPTPPRRPTALRRGWAQRAPRPMGRATGSPADAAAERGDGRAGWPALDEPFEGAPFPALAAALPDGAVLWAGNSMPVRDLDGWLPSTDRAITVRSNRGANGIDGVVSTALGSAAVGGRTRSRSSSATCRSCTTSTRCVAARLHGLSATIVLVNNDGGGIFSFLPQAQAGASRAPACPSTTRSCSGRRTGSTSAPIVTALGGEHVPRRGTRDLARGDRGVRRAAGRPGPRAADGPRPERGAPSRGGGGRRRERSRRRCRA